MTAREVTPPVAVGAPPLHGLVLILGGRGSGKTTALQHVEATHRPLGCRFVIYDRLGQWSDARGRIVVREGTPEDAGRVAIEHAPCTLILDEAHLGYPVDAPPRPGSALHEIALVGRQAAAYGRWRRRGPVALLAASQRPAGIATNVRNLLDRLYLGRFPPTAIHDLRWVAEATQNEELARKLTTLRPGEFEVVDCQ